MGTVHSAVRQALCLLLSLLLLFSVFVLPVSAAEKITSGADYPTVFMHGLLGWGAEDGLDDVFPYWGMAGGDMPTYLREKGYDLFVADVGPLSSGWDRCCELFAQLAGARVDYGQAHADRCNAEFAQNGASLTHDRYGRDYTGRPGVANWGPVYDAEGKVTGFHDNKINLVGHSFGGPVALEFLHLLAEGDEDERAWAKQQAAQNGGDWHDYISPLFWGDYDGEYLINSITSLAGVLNGTTFIPANDGAMALLKPLSALLANAVGTTDLALLYDFQLEQFGLTRLPGTDMKARFTFLGQSGFLSGTDHAFYDLTVAGTNEMKTDFVPYDNVYYFSYAGDKTYSLGGRVLPDADMFALFIPFSMKMGAYTNENELVLNIDGSVGGAVDAEWLPNDGMVNTISSRYPFGAPHKDYDPKAIEAGVWNVHPDLALDHFAFPGGFVNFKPWTVAPFFDGLMEDIERTSPVFGGMTTENGGAHLALPETTVSVSRLLGKPVLTWSKVVDADSYTVLRSETEDGTYTAVGTSLLPVFTDLTARGGRTYYYRIEAVSDNRNVASSLSAPVKSR